MDSQTRISAFYEMSMAIGNSLELDRMLKEALGVIMSRMNALAAVVYRVDGERRETVYAKPKVWVRNETFSQMADELIGAWEHASEPYLIREHEGRQYGLFELKYFGFLLLLSDGRPYNDVTYASFSKIALRLASAIDACRNNQRVSKLVEQYGEAEAVAGMGSWEWNLKSGGVYWSDGLYRLLAEVPQSFQPSVFRYKHYLDAEGRRMLRHYVRVKLRGGETQAFEHRLIRADGTVRQVESSVRLTLDEAGAPSHVTGTVVDVTERQRKIELDRFLNNALNEMYIIDLETLRYRYASKGALKRTGYTLDELRGMDVFDLNPGLSMARVEEIKAQLAREGIGQNMSLHRCKDGTTYPVQALIQQTVFEGRDAHVIFDTDVSELFEAQEKVQSQERFLQSVIDGIKDTVIVIDMEYNVRLMNRAAREQYGAVSPDACLLKCHHARGPNSGLCSNSAIPCPMDAIRESGKEFMVAYQEQGEGEKPRHVELVASPLRNAGTGELEGIIEIGRDITERIRAQNELRDQKESYDFIAHHDPLTRLPNRTLLVDRLEHALKVAGRNREQVGVLFVDLDRFKEINDSLGHGIGDRVLQAIADIFRHSVRESDTIARLGGDEFMIVVEPVTGPEGASEVARKLIEALREPIRIDDNELYVGASIGISIFPHDGSTPETLLRNADSAMYRAKDEGKNTYRFYTADMTAQAFERVVLESSMRQALSVGEFVLYYQPQYDIEGERLVGVEALIRWQHSALGLVSPGSFIPIAEETGLILPIGEWVLREAAQRAAQWRSEGLDPGKVSVNVSPKQLRDPDLIDKIRRILRESGCRPEWMELEVTESSVMHEPEEAIRIFGDLVGMGISIAIDDFGTGYSSLSYLKRFPISRLKVDQSFVRDVPGDVDDEAIVRAVILLGRSMGMRVIAEGVETTHQHAFLSHEGCHEVQGYYFGRPLSEEQVHRLLKRQAQHGDRE